MNKTTTGCANCKYYFNGECINADSCPRTNATVFNYSLNRAYPMPTEIVINGVTYTLKENNK